MAGPDWSLLHTFLRAAETGSLSEAARALGLSQPTVTRQIRTLEEQLGVSLFVRHSRGVTLSERGAELLSSARAVDAQVQGVFRRAAGLREVPSGEVRVSVNEPIGVYVLPRVLSQLHARYPELQVTVVIDNRTSDLSRREADIALRMFKPEQLDLVARHIADVEVGIYASAAYVERNGLPDGADLSKLALRGHTIVGPDQDPTFREALRALGLKPSDVAIRSDNILLQMACVVDGIAVGGVQARVAEELGLVRVPNLVFPPLPLWIVTHAELRASVPVRAVFQVLSEALGQYYGGAPGFSG